MNENFWVGFEKQASAISRFLAKKLQVEGLSKKRHLADLIHEQKLIMMDASTHFPYSSPSKLIAYRDAVMSVRKKSNALPGDQLKRRMLQNDPKRLKESLKHNINKLRTAVKVD